MQYRQLGYTDIKVSLICLGTMTFGEQNTQAEGFAQLDYALDQGVNFIDTAELYAIPPKAETYGATEQIVGNWLKQSGKRDDVILASKVVGKSGDWLPHIRNGNTRLDKENITTALEGSLARLQTDYLDLYQLHWPDRNTNFFGKLGYPGELTPDQIGKDEEALLETLEVLDGLVKAGKVRHIGVSNETAWGVMKYLQLADKYDLPRMVSIQNPYNLLNRSFEVGLAEVAQQEQCGLMAYSPLGFGVLSGKYLDNTADKNARLTLYPDYDRYSNEQAIAATKAYATLARKHDMTPTQMALAYINSRPFLTSNIIGATNMHQLQENIDSVHITLSDDVLASIENIHHRYTYPSP